MKIVFCGPPHSGKSVLIANLIEQMPTDAHTIIRACPDGEGNWSNNPNQDDIKEIRQKGKFTKSFIDNVCEEIDNQTNPIVLVDVGGMISKENEQVFKHCDSFVVLSDNEEKRKEWLAFGESLGLTCIAYLDSKLNDKEEAIYAREPYLQGKVVGLSRGKVLENRQVISAIASDIIRRSGYSLEKQNNQETTIDDTKLGFQLGYGKEVTTEHGNTIKQVKWKEEAVPEVYQQMQQDLNEKKSITINGVRANFILSAICKAAKEKGVKEIKTYDVKTQQYIPIQNIPKKNNITQCQGLSYGWIENEKSIFLDVDITGEKYTLEDYKQCVLPKIKEEKDLYLSGRMPLWLLASISNSYDSHRIFTFQPGKGFTCISSNDEKDLGTVVDGIEGIDINRYYRDKRKQPKEEDKTNLPVVAKKQGLLSKIKNLLTRIKTKNKLPNYLDETIKANKINGKKHKNNSFKDNIKVDEQNRVEVMNGNHLEQTEEGRENIGG